MKREEWKECGKLAREAEWLSDQIELLEYRGAREKNQAALIRSHKRRLEEIRAAQLRAEKELAALPERERTMMRLRYMEGLRWILVARRMHYSVQWIQALHAKVMAEQERKDKDR